MNLDSSKHNSLQILSLSSNISMILAALGLTEQVKGRTLYCADAVKRASERPELKTFFNSNSVSAWDNIEVVGNWLTPDPVKIAQLKPNLVISSGTCTSYNDKTLGIAPDRWLHFNILTINDLYNSINIIGERTDTCDRAIALINQLKDTALHTSESIRNNNRKKPKIVHERCICIKPEIYANPVNTIMIGGHLAPEMIEMAGGISGLSQPGETCRWIDSNLVVDYQPDIIIDNRCTTCPIRKDDKIEDREGWNEIPAVKNKRVFRLKTNIANPNLCFNAGLEEIISIILDNE